MHVQADKVRARLTIRDIPDLAPLGPDADAPFVPASLAEPLFGGPQATYAVLDAATIPVLPELLAAQDLPHVCLAKDGSGDILAAVSPWLVKLEPDTPLLRALFTKGEAHMTCFWGTDAGIFLRSDAPLDKIANHLRALLKVRNTDGKMVWFRFWDPAVIAAYLSAVTDWPERIDSLFASRFLSDPTLIAVETGKARARVVVPSGARSRGLPFTLTERDLAILALPQQGRMKSELADWLLRLDPGRFRPFGPARRLAVAEHVALQGARYGFTFFEEYAHLLYRMTYLGGWFHLAPDFAPFTEALSPVRPARMPEMSADFPREYARLMPSEEERTAILTRLAQAARNPRGRFNRAAPEELRALTAIAEGLLPKGAGPEAARSETRAALPDADIHGRALFYLLRLTCGPHPHGDPLYPAIREKGLATSATDVNLDTAADFYLRRLQRLI
ncbi:DUF4123 domain-containing protein [Jannaschia pohangensis]|uniref:DUF4123 domain-containing protein n=1 Tax=Jannaschia pohangensis TaxID=390807 RepID=A0A1I3U7L5_9RHOB|nr:DUF4123 domain-containing protein [Jannaschia pohangensis]SFJ79000.1 protein of unknown function [Jannaschia pohangensis]